MVGPIRCLGHPLSSTAQEKWRFARCLSGQINRNKCKGAASVVVDIGGGGAGALGSRFTNAGLFDCLSVLILFCPSLSGFILSFSSFSPSFPPFLLPFPLLSSSFILRRPSAPSDIRPNVFFVSVWCSGYTCLVGPSDCHSCFVCLYPHPSRFV